MTEQEQQQTQQNHQIIALHPIYGAVPALIGVVIVIAHVRGALVSHEHQGILLGACLSFVCLSLAMWLHYGMEIVVRRVVAHFDERHDEAQDAAERRHAEVMGQVTRLHYKADRMCARTKGIERRLVNLEKQGNALGRVFIEEGLPDWADRANLRRWRGEGGVPRRAIALMRFLTCAISCGRSCEDK